MTTRLTDEELERLEHFTSGMRMKQADRERLAALIDEVHALRAVAAAARQVYSSPARTMPDGIVRLGDTLRAAGLALLALLFLIPATARAGDPIPFFKPDPKPPTKPYGPPKPHPVATECAYNDVTCLREHDASTLDWALGLHDREWCTRAIHVNKCKMVYEFIMDEGAGAVKKRKSDDPMLADPCTFVVSIDHGVAALYSFRLQRWLLIENDGWMPAEYIGECDVGKLPPREVQGVQTLPGFPWVRHARLP